LSYGPYASSMLTLHCTVPSTNRKLYRESATFSLEARPQTIL
jgi:hypothetical protein